MESGTTHLTQIFQQINHVILLQLLSMDLAHQESKKKNRRKLCRYEREHSMSAAHIYWHENPLLGLQVCSI